MAFDFSQYTGGTTPTVAATPQTLGALPAGITSADIPQMQYLMNSPILTDPSTQMNTDSEGNTIGAFKDLNPDEYKTAEDQWNEQQKLITAGMLNAPTQTGGGDGSPLQTISGGYGAAVPDAIAHRDGTQYQNSAANEAGQLVYAGDINDTSGSANNGDQKLLNPSATMTDPNWGTFTQQGNIDQSHGTLSDLGWKIAPLVPAIAATLLSGGAGAAMFGALPESSANSALSAGMLAGDQTAGMFGGALNTGVEATAGDVLSSLPASIQKYLPNAVKSGISQLGSNGKYNPLSMIEGAAGSMLNLPPSIMQAINAGVGLSQGGGFDFSKYLPQGISMLTKGIG